MTKSSRKSRTPQLSEGAVRQVLRFETYRLVARVAAWPIRIACLWFPLQALQPIAEALAGKDTSVTTSIQIAWGATLGMLVVTVSLYGQNRRLKKRANEVESAEDAIYRRLGLELEL